MTKKYLALCVCLIVVADVLGQSRSKAAKQPRLVTQPREVIAVAKNLEEYKKHLLKPLEPSNRIVKPFTAYSKGRVLRPDEKYYQIDDCAVIRERGEMRIVGYTFVKFRG